MLIKFFEYKVGSWSLKCWVKIFDFGFTGIPIALIIRWCIPIIEGEIIFTTICTLVPGLQPFIPVAMAVDYGISHIMKNSAEKKI